MTTVITQLHTARPPAPPPLPVVETAAQVFDLLSPLLWDFTPFTEALEQEIRAWPGSPRVYEFGTGAGHVALPLLGARPDLVYHGFEWSAELAALFERKARRLPAGSGWVSCTAPCRLSLRALREPVRGMRADVIVLTEFLAHVPPRPDGDALHRVAFLSLCAQMLKPGGRLFVFEQVEGESAEEQLALLAGWERVAQTRMRERLRTLHHPAHERDPDFDALMRQVVRDPLWLRALREELGAPEPEGLPLSGWQQLFQHLGFRCHTIPHHTLRNFYLFVIKA
ncbi:MAG TPA: class I SAM-dependent methyltransferase [Gemmatimonadales bacterium]